MSTVSDTVAAPTTNRSLPPPAQALVRRLRLTCLALVYVLLAVPALALVCLLTTSLALAIITIGLPLLLAFVPLNQVLADVHRRIAGSILGVRIDADYQVRRGSSPLDLIRTWAGDPARWRDFAWAWMSATIGWVLAWIPVGLGLLVLWYAVFPFVYWVSPEGVFDMDYGILTIDTQAEAFLEWTWLLVSLVAWWMLVPAVMHWRARLDRALL
ncbi:sensor domain-containing protein [Nocardioides sp.]|uniref:sensor domain-containing protein n=1 Tax=Nocardioides sp. TaxID=35761 RepID=UPI003D0E851A